MHVPREICRVSYKKATLLQDSRCAFHKIPFCAKMSVAMKSLKSPSVCKDVQKAAVSLWANTHQAFVWALLEGLFNQGWDRNF